MKRVVTDTLHGTAKKQKKMSRAEQLIHLPSHRRAFSRAWLALLALPLNSSQHKVVLKHLPEHVIGVLTQPLLLADYLTQSYEQGTIVVLITSYVFLIPFHFLQLSNFSLQAYML